MSNFDQIQAYLENEMTQAEKLQFESMLQANSDLNKEYVFQSEIIEGLKKERHQQLKNRLNAVEVGEFAGQYGLVKILASVTIAAVVGVGAFLYFSNDSVEVTPPSETKSLAIDDEHSHATVLDEKDTETTVTKNVPIEVAKPKAQDSDKQVTAQELTSTDESTDKIIESSEEVVTVKSNRPVKPDVIEDFEEVSKDDNVELPNIEKSLGNKGNFNKSNIEIETDNSRKKYSFHYQFKNGKLFLLGSFDKGLYEILEFNKADGRNLYLFYNDNFYAIDENNKEITPLSKIEDEKVIDNLRNLKNNKP